VPRRAADEEDVALSAFHSFCKGAGDGRFSQLCDRDSLWPLLVAITAHKAIDLIRRENRRKRGGAHPVADCVNLQDLLGREPTPEFVAQVAEEYERLLDRLEDDGLRSIAAWKMEGCTVAEIATRLGCVARTVERKLRMIRRLWGEEAVP
jgi:DNA-directed RNA polymerase specialized sigma24 family protein